jgi:hypothetical protein
LPDGQLRRDDGVHAHACTCTHVRRIRHLECKAHRQQRAHHARTHGTHRA